MLTVIATLNYADRELPFILAEQIKADLDINDTILAIVTSFGFLIVYAVAGVFLARIADLGFPGMVIIGSLLIWSAMTGLAAMVTTALFFAVARIGVAFGEAGNTPASHSLIANWFGPNKRALPLAFLTMAAPIGSALSLILGGYLGQLYGWRTTFMIFAVAGVILAPVALVMLSYYGVMRSPPSDHKPKPMFQEIGGFLARPSFRDLLIGKAMWAMATYAMITFIPAFLMRMRDMSMMEVSTQFGITKGAISVAVLLLVGYLANQMRGQSLARLPMILIWMALSVIPLTIGGILVEDSFTAVLLLSGARAIGVAMLAPVIAVMQCIVPPQARASASAVFLMVVSLAGALGPVLTGFISDLMAPSVGASSIWYGMVIIPVLQIGAVLMYWKMSRRFADDIIEE